MSNLTLARIREGEGQTDPVFSWIWKTHVKHDKSPWNSQHFRVDSLDICKCMYTLPLSRRHHIRSSSYDISDSLVLIGFTSIASARSPSPVTKIGLASGIWPDFWGHRLTKDPKCGYHRLPLIASSCCQKTDNTFSISRSSRTISGRTAEGPTDPRPLYTSDV